MLRPFELVKSFHCSISSVSIYYGPQSDLRLKKLCPFELLKSFNFSISSVLIYYAPESDIRMKSYDHLNFSRASVIHFQASWYIMGLNRTPMSKVMAVWIGRELSCSILTALIYFAPKSDIQGYSYDILNFSGASVVHFLPYRYIMVSIIQPSQKLWLFEFAESFHVLFRVSWYIMRLNLTSVWKVMTIWISRELSFFNFERLDILCAWIWHPN